MKKLAMALLIGSISTGVLAQGTVYHRGYVRQDGTYVQPHQQTAPNSTPNDNWSTRGNTNPVTGQPGTVDPYRTRPYDPYGH